MSGDLDTADLLSSVTTIFSTGHADLGVNGDLVFFCSFELKSPEGKKKRIDQIGVTMRQGLWSLEYTIGGVESISRKRDYFVELAKTIQLPISTEWNGDHYLIKHTEGGKLQLSETVNFLNPSRIGCEITKRPINSLAEMIGSVFQQFGTGKIMKASWASFPSEETEHRNKKFFKTLLGKNYPAKSIHVSGDYTVDDLASIERMRVMGGGETELETILGEFKLPTGTTGDVAVVTQRKEHILSVGLSTPKGLKAVEGLLKLKFKPM